LNGAARPTLAVWKFSSCDGCQLSLLDCEDEILALASAVDIAYFLEAGHDRVDATYDVSLVEGSITTAGDVERIRRVREASRLLVTIGACATAGGIQALRNFGNVADYTSIVYAHPEFISTLATSTPIADHVTVDLELRGCPISRSQLLETLAALLNGRRPHLPSTPVCAECKRLGNPCIVVTEGKACLGPVTQSGCAALCPSFGRGCFGCYGPVAGGDVSALNQQLADLGMTPVGRGRLFRTFNAWSPAFRQASTAALDQFVDPPEESP